MGPSENSKGTKLSEMVTEPTRRRRRLNESFHYYRFVVIIFGGIAFGLMKLLRFNVSLAIVNMVNQTEVYLREHPNKTVEDFLAEGYELGGEFDWSYEIQNMIMSWYMISYTLPQVATTKLGLIIGCQLAIPLLLSICVVATLLTPMSAYWGWQWVVGMRLLDGLGASAVLPIMLNLIENWMPYEDISLGLTVAHICQNILSSTGPVFIGFLTSIHWSYAFYGPGLMVLVFCLLWLVFVNDKPENSWLISQNELELIKRSTDDSDSSQKSAQLAYSEQRDQGRKLGVIDILRVPSFYAYIICMVAHCSTYSGFFFILPTYLGQFLRIGIAQNGMFNSIISIGQVAAVLWPHPVWKFLQTRLGLSLTASARITYALGASMVALTWLYVGAFHNLQLLMLFLGRCFHGCNDILLMGSLMRNYANVGLSGLAFSVVNSIGNLSTAFVSPLIGWYLDRAGGNSNSWFWIYTMLASSQLIIMAIFSTIIHSDPVDLEREGNKKDNSSTGSHIADDRETVGQSC